MSGIDDHPRWVVSIDAGGTFTDAVAKSSIGDLIIAKVDSTPEDPAKGLMHSLDELEAQGVNLRQTQLFGHGTTVATNAMITGNIARALLVTTVGFRDIMGYRQSIRPSLYSLTPERPLDMVQRRDCIEMDERLDSAGAVVKELQQEEVERIVEQIRQRKPEAIAVSLLFSYLNDVHEKMLGRRIRAEFPEVPVTLSSEVAREFREYPRTATTVINAALRPIVTGYLERAKQGLTKRSIEAPVVVMQSNGGCVSLNDAGPQAHRLLLSGPAGGVAGLLEIAEEHKLANLISFDMGGTSLDVCLVRDGTIPVASQQVVRDHTLISPSVDIHTIGAGGGSIAWLDESNRLRVGPQSAGATPGPAAYDRGGTDTTITDAHVILGTLGTEALAGGLTLNKQQSIEALEPLATQLSMSVSDAADAVIAISLAQMIRAVRKVSIERGLDPRNFTIVPFGGAGPLHASLILRHMGLQGVIVPAQPGVFAANGLLSAGLRIDESQTVLMKFSEQSAEEISTWINETQTKMLEQLREDSVPEAGVVIDAHLDCRYQGQGYEISVPIDGDGVQAIRAAVDEFHIRHAELYGHSDKNQIVEIVTVRASTQGYLVKLRPEHSTKRSQSSSETAVVEERKIRFPGTEHETNAKIYDRNKLQFGNVIEGPALIVQMDSTTVLLSEQIAEVLHTGDISIKEQNNG